MQLRGNQLLFIVRCNDHRYRRQLCGFAAGWRAGAYSLKEQDKDCVAEPSMSNEQKSRPKQILSPGKMHFAKNHRINHEQYRWSTLSDCLYAFCKTPARRQRRKIALAFEKTTV